MSIDNMMNSYHNTCVNLRRSDFIHHLDTSRLKTCVQERHCGAALYEVGEAGKHPGPVRVVSRDATWLLRFYALSPQAEYYYQQLSARNLQPRVHINKIVALADIHGPEKVALALQDAIECQAFSSQYIENILHQRARLCPPSGPLHLTHRTDLLDLDLNPVDLTPYDLP